MATLSSPLFLTSVSLPCCQICRPLVEDPSSAAYLSALASAGRLSLVGDWFTRHELHLATELLLLSSAHVRAGCTMCGEVLVELLHCW